MNIRQRVVLCVMSLLLCLGAASAIGGASVVVAESATWTQRGAVAGPSGFVIGTSRIMVYQTEVAVDPAAYGLAASAGNAWVVSILDITNFGTAPHSASLVDFRIVTVEGGDVIAADKGQGPSAALGYAEVQADGSFTVPVDSTVRVAVAFAVPEKATMSFQAVLGFGDEQANIESTVVESLDAAALPAVQPWIGAQGAVQAVPGKGVVEVNVGGTIQSVALAGVATPPADGCFGAESSAAVTTLSGGSVWVEDDPSSDGSLVWYWDGGRGHLALLNQALVEQGLGTYDDAYEGSGYAPWLSAKGEVVEEEGNGLWGTCKGVGGEWINPPTPAPEPTKTADEVRAGYTWVDTRDLAIRPNEFNGEKIAVQGSVFNIQVDADGFTTMQIWLDGGSDAAVIGFDGDSTGIYEGTWVTVYGTGFGTFEGTNMMGGTISQPLIMADIVDR